VKTKKPFFFKNTESNFEKFVSDFLFETLIEIEINTVGAINIALSGGNTPLPVLDLLHKMKLSWDRFNFFMVDERCVANDDPLSNFGNIQKVFFSKIVSAKFPMVQDGISYNQSIAIYKDEIIKHIPINANGFPEFDLILLGMGDDGHTASLFPKTKALLETKELVVLNEVPQLQTKRITITYPLLLNSKEIIVIVKGESKEKIIKELYSGASNDYPMLKLANSHSNLKWLIG
jgi:6-phosphogluconolactonase